MTRCGNAAVGELAAECGGELETATDAGREVRRGDEVVGGDRAKELGIRLCARRKRLERDEARDVADDVVQVAIDARRAEAKVARANDALNGAADRGLILRPAGSVEILQVLPEDEMRVTTMSKS